MSYTVPVVKLLSESDLLSWSDSLEPLTELASFGYESGSDVGVAVMQSRAVGRVLHAFDVYAMFNDPTFG